MPTIVTLVIGERMRYLFDTLYRPSWEIYAARHGYKILIFDHILDRSTARPERCPAWQKCLILDQPETRDLDRVIWMDADIVIHPDAPEITSHAPVEKVGAIDQWNTPTPAIAASIRDAYATAARRKGVDPAEQACAAEYHTRYGLSEGHASVVQTGVMILSPRHHNDTFLAAYQWDRPDPYHYEMPVLSHEIQSRSLAHWIDPRFNILWLEQLHYHYSWIDKIQSPLWERLLRRASAGRYTPWLERELRKAARAVHTNSWFLHFAGAHPDARLLNHPTAHL